MPTKWTRTDAAYGAQEALDAVDDGTPWAIVWCGGGVSRSSDTPVDEDGKAYVRRHLVEPAQRERLFAKSQRRRATKTVVMAERWEHPQRGPLILFYEGGPYLLPDRDDPTEP